MVQYLVTVQLYNHRNSEVVIGMPWTSLRPQIEVFRGEVENDSRFVLQGYSLNGEMFSRQLVWHDVSQYVICTSFHEMCGLCLRVKGSDL